MVRQSVAVALVKRYMFQPGVFSGDRFTGLSGLIAGVREKRSCVMPLVQVQSGMQHVRGLAFLFTGLNPVLMQLT